MIIEALFELIFVLLEIVFQPVKIEALPVGIQNVVDSLVDVITSGVGILAIFIDLEVLSWLVPIIIVIVNFERIWNLIMFILRKIPFIGIE